MGRHAPPAPRPAAPAGAVPPQVAPASRAPPVAPPPGLMSSAAAQPAGSFVHNDIDSLFQEMGASTTAQRSEAPQRTHAQAQDMAALSQLGGLIAAAPAAGAPAVAPIPDPVLASLRNPMNAPESPPQVGSAVSRGGMQPTGLPAMLASLQRPAAATAERAAPQSGPALLAQLSTSAPGPAAPAEPQSGPALLAQLAAQGEASAISKSAAQAAAVRALQGAVAPAPGRPPPPPRPPPLLPLQSGPPQPGPPRPPAGPPPAVPRTAQPPSVPPPAMHGTMGPLAGQPMPLTSLQGAVPVAPSLPDVIVGRAIAPIATGVSDHSTRATALASVPQPSEGAGVRKAALAGTAANELLAKLQLSDDADRRATAAPEPAAGEQGKPAKSITDPGIDFWDKLTRASDTGE